MVSLFNCGPLTLVSEWMVNRQGEMFRLLDTEWNHCGSMYCLQDSSGKKFWDGTNRYRYATLDEYERKKHNFANITS